MKSILKKFDKKLKLLTFGFTLVELLAVISIISILLILVAPKIANQLNNSKRDVNDVTKKIIYSAAEKYIKDNNINFQEEEIKCIPVKELHAEEYLSDNITDNKSGIDLNENKSIQVKYNNSNGYKYELMDKTKCNISTGMLVDGLTPVAYDKKNKKWIVVSQTNKNNEWYDYDNQKWANAVVLGTDVTKEVGDEVKVDGSEAKMMLVWIPRFEYKYTNLGNQYAGGTQKQPGGIDINFIPKNVTNSSSNEYKIHPAFEFGNDENDMKHLNGIWIGKFELSHTTLSSNTTSNNLKCSTINCTSASGLRILPSVQSLRYNNISNFWYGIKSIENTNSFGLSNVDIHMAKNSEWGAVAYLSQSKYGKYGNNDYNIDDKQLYQNKSDSYITGLSTSNLCTYDNFENNCGYGASTTGNIYGVYDMRGGALEFVMGVYGTNFPIVGSSGFDASTFTNNTIEKKYYDLYTTNIANTACNGELCYGHALSETAGWYENIATMVKDSEMWLIRGGYNLWGTAGIFYYYQSTGSLNNYRTTRVILITNSFDSL